MAAATSLDKEPGEHAGAEGGRVDADDDVLVEARPDPSIDAVGAEVVHEEGDDRVGEEVLARPVDHRRQAAQVQRVAQDDRVQVRAVGGHEDAGAALAQAADEIHSSPSKQLTLVGITGTNGKTTTGITEKQNFFAR